MKQILMSLFIFAAMASALGGCAANKGAGSGGGGAPAADALNVGSYCATQPANPDSEKSTGCLDANVVAADGSRKIHQLQVSGNFQCYYYNPRTDLTEYQKQETHKLLHVAYDPSFLEADVYGNRFGLGFENIKFNLKLEHEVLNTSANLKWMSAVVSYGMYFQKNSNSTCESQIVRNGQRLTISATCVTPDISDAKSASAKAHMKFSCNL